MFEFYLTTKSLTPLDLSKGDPGKSISDLMKTHVKTDEDIDVYILAAIGFIESESGRSIRERNTILETRLDKSGQIDLFRGPVTKVNSFKYYLSDVLITIPDTDYKLITVNGDKLIPVYGKTWPCVGSRVEIDYETGLGLLSELVFPAVAMLAGHFYKNREAVESGTKVPVEVPMAARSLINLIMDE